MLTIRRATTADLHEILAFYREAQHWLSDRGLNQWQPFDEDPAQYLARVEEKFQLSITVGTCFAALIEGQIVGTITLDTYADPEFWVEDDRPDQALYIHRMIVSRQAAGTNIGADLLDWAAVEATRQGKRWLRLDAWQANPSLHRYYQSQGFIHVRSLSYTHRGSGALFQREIHRSRQADG